MNEFDAAVRAHADDSEATSVVDPCFAAGWVAALDAVMRAAGNLPSGGGLVAELRAQANDYYESEEDPS